MVDEDKDVLNSSTEEADANGKASQNQDSPIKIPEIEATTFCFENSDDGSDCDATSKPNDKSAKKKDNTGNEPPSVSQDMIPHGEINATAKIDKTVRDNALESDRAYRKITEDIIEKTSEQLTEHNYTKKPLRRKLMTFVIVLLSLQFAVLVAILFLNRRMSLQISDNVINAYIVSLFVETLAGLIIMIKFAFDSTQEVELISILNSVIVNFKKYEEK